MVKMSEERVPVSEVITVLEQRTLYKNNKWWSAVVLGEQFGKKRVFWYLWNSPDNSGSGWKRKQKITIGGKRNWEDAKPAIDELVAKL